MSKEFELISHTADQQIRVYGRSLEELYRHALKGMFVSIHPRGPYITYTPEFTCTKYTAEHTITLQAETPELLLIDFLSDCLYLSDVHNQAYFDAQFLILTSTQLQAIIFGTEITGFSTEIKAVTYHTIEIKNINGLWQTDIVFDI